MENLTVPTNAKTGNEYSGKNIGILLCAQEENGFPTAQWCTFRQALDLGRCVVKGQKASAEIVKVITKKVKNKNTGKLEEKKIVKAYKVFNIAQTAETPAKEVAAA